MANKCIRLLERTCGLCVPICRITINLFNRLLVNCQLQCEWTYESCVPTYIRINRKVIQIENQRLTSCVSISPILSRNMAHFTVQSHPFHHAKWVRLKNDETHVGTHGSCVHSVFQLFTRQPCWADARAVRPYRPIPCAWYNHLLISCFPFRRPDGYGRPFRCPHRCFHRA